MRLMELLQQEFLVSAVSGNRANNFLDDVDDGAVVGVPCILMILEYGCNKYNCVLGKMVRLLDLARVERLCYWTSVI